MATERTERLKAGAPKDFAADLIEFTCEPAFGARSKRELELRMFELLYRERLDNVSVGAIADDLAIPRSRARTLLLETRSRVLADEPDAERKKRLRDALCSWSETPRMELEAGRLRFIIDDPYLRDSLKTHAYKEGVVIDGSFTGEIVSITWASWARLVASLLAKSDYDAAAQHFAAAIRKRVAKDDALTAKLRGDETDPTWLQQAAGVAGDQAPKLLGNLAIELGKKALIGV